MKQEYKNPQIITKRYMCDGPLCKNELAVTPPSICEVVVETQNEVIIPSAKAMPDITDHGWCRMVINNKFCHVCPKCQDHIIAKSFYQLDDDLANAFMRNLPSDILKVLSRVFKDYFIRKIIRGHWEY